MELKDVTSLHIPSQQTEGQTAVPFAEQFGEPARRYRLRQPSNRPYRLAALVSAFWLGGAVAFVLGYLGLNGFLALDWPWIAGVIFAVVFPISFMWLAALMAKRSHGLQLASEDLLQISARLVEPDTAAGREIQSVGRAVRREIDALNTGLEGALLRVRNLEGAMAERLAAMEESARSLEERGDVIRTALREEREHLATLVHAVSADADRMGEHMRSRTQALRDLVKQSADDISAAQELIDSRAVMLRDALHAASAAALANAQTADRGSATLLSAAEQLDKRLDGFIQRGERQRSVLNEAVGAMKAETQALETAIGQNLDALSGIGQSLAEQTRRADAVASEIVRRGETASGAIGARVEAIAASFAGQVERLDGVAGAAEARLKDVVAAASDAAEQTRAAFEMAARGANSAAEQSSHAAHKAISLIAEALTALGARTQEAQSAAQLAVSELRAEADALPALLAERVKAIRAADLAALNPPETESETALSAPGEDHASTSHPDTDGQRDKPEWFGFARRLAGLIRKEPDAAAKSSDWRLSTALANVDDNPLPPPGRRTPSSRMSVDLHREALHVVEKLQALAIDLDRALGDDPAPDLWRRYVNGERSVFTRRLVSMIGREGADRIAERYAADPEFRAHADRYMTEFEGLLDDAAARDRDQVLAETFLTSQTGRLYLLLAAAVGRL